MGLLRRLRPPSRTLALSRPTTVGQTVWEFPSANAGAESVPEVPALRRVVSGTPGAGGRPTHHPPSHGGPGVTTRFTWAFSRRLHPGCSRHPRSQGWSVIRLRVSSSRTVVRTLQTQRLAKPRRLLRGADAMVHASLLCSHLLRRSRAHPLRTVRATFTAHRSSISKAVCRTPQPEKHAGCTILDGRRFPTGEGSTSGTKPPTCATPSVPMPPLFACRDTRGKSARFRGGSWCRTAQPLSTS